MREESTSVPGLRPAVGRMANALVAVLGPELTQGSKAYNLTKALIREMQVEIPFKVADIPPGAVASDVFFLAKGQL